MNVPEEELDDIVALAVMEQQELDVRCRAKGRHLKVNIRNLRMLSAGIGWFSCPAHHLMAKQLCLWVQGLM